MEPIHPKEKVLVNPNFIGHKTNNTIAVNPLFLRNNSLLSACLKTTQAMPGHGLQLAANSVPKIHINPMFFQPQVYEEMLKTQKIKEEEKEMIKSEVNDNNNNNTAPLLENEGILAAVLPVASRKLSRNATTEQPRTSNYSTTEKKKSTTLKSHDGIVGRKLVHYTLPPPVTPTMRNTLSTPQVSTFPIIAQYKIDNRLSLPSNTEQQKMPMRTLNRSFRTKFALPNSRYQFVKKYKEMRSFPKDSQGRISIISSYRKFKFPNNNAVQDLRNIASHSHSPSNNLYKKTNIGSKIQQSPNLHGRIINVRGMKFLMNKNCNKLIRLSTAIENPKRAASTVAVATSTAGYIPGPTTGPTAGPTTGPTPSRTSSTTKMGERIHIGGFTYVASRSQNLFVCTNNHWNLAHLRHAKHRSLWMLRRQRLVKSNVPCAIFQCTGKCKAHEQGKCNKLHDKKQVAICTRFLRGDCVKPNCSLSHNVSFYKMPVCRFFLQGFCTKDDCPYLHKKLSNKAEICLDFLRGYCKLAEQCNKRHEFLCPRLARNEKCLARDCLICQRIKRKNKRSLEAERKREESPKLETPKQIVHDNIVGNTTLDDIEKAARYYSLEQERSDEVKEDEEEETEFLVDTVRRPPLGPFPDFIPLEKNITSANS